MTVTALRQTGPDEAAVCLSGGEEIRTTLNVVADLRLFAGCELEEEALRKLREKKQEFPLEEDILILPEDALIEKLDRAERDRLVREAVLSLPQPDREIFLSHYYYCQ